MKISRSPLWFYPILILLACQNVKENPAVASSRDSRSETSRKQVAIFIFDGVQIIDFTGPYEVFGAAGYQVFTVAESLEPITTSMGMTVVPDYDLTTHPQADIIVLPGGNVPHQLDSTDRRIVWIEKQAPVVDHIMSVCNGVFFLTSTNLVQGLRITTNAGMLPHLSHFAPASEVIYDARFTDNGQIITAGGFSAGIDAALHLVGKLDGRPALTYVANNGMEYNWQANESYSRYDMADAWIPIFLDVYPPLFDKKIIKYEGDRDQWESIFHIRRQNIDELIEQLQEIAQMNQWDAIAKISDSSGTDLHYTLKDALGNSWSLNATVQPLAEPDFYSLEIRVGRLTRTAE